MDRGIRNRSTWINCWMQTTLLCLISVSVSHSVEVNNFAPDLYDDTQWIQEDLPGIPISNHRPVTEYREPGILNVKYDWKSSYYKGLQNQYESIGPSEKPGNYKNSPKVFPCPEAVDITPCVCTEFGIQLDLQCSRLSSEDELKSIFLQDFPAKSFTSLHITDSPNIQTLGDIFNGVSFEYVNIVNTGLQFVSEYFLVDSLDTLISLVIIDSKITSNSFPFLSLSSYTYLENLYIRGNDLTHLPVLRSDSLVDLQIFFGSIAEIESDVLQGLPNLELVGLGTNKLTSLPAGLTSNLPELYTVAFSFNDITRIEAGVFDFTDTFFSIILAYNQISEIEPGAFVVPPLAYNNATGGFLDVDLSHNQITTLDEEVYGEIFPYLYRINLTNNPLTCGCDLAWLILNDEFFDKISPDAACTSGTLLVDLNPNEFGQFC